ncbi:hypothetical protein J6590_045564 [Homalodisca vitripennis]|nr:hypothetical protein J6590_092188 [Homalodisca vitripennis]KAG8321498.1 hypothetical protein J6590_045564 [Homalodisca vitripennis]
MTGGKLRPSDTPVCHATSRVRGFPKFLSGPFLFRHLWRRGAARRRERPNKPHPYSMGDLDTCGPKLAGRGVLSPRLGVGPAADTSCTPRAWEFSPESRGRRGWSLLTVGLVLTGFILSSLDFTQIVRSH